MKPSELYERVQQSQDNGRYFEAEERLQAHLSFSPDDYEARRLLSRVLWDQGKQQQGIAESERLTRELKNHPSAWFNLGNMYNQAQQYAAAGEAYARTVELAPDYLGAHYNLGNLFSAENRNQDAIKAYRRALEISPTYFPAWVNLGVVLRSIGESQQALEAFEQAHQLAPDDELVLRNIEYLRNRQLQGWHLQMLADSARNDAYDQAICNAVSTHTRVLDIGAGSGLLAMMAARAKAHSVVACEMDSPIACAAGAVIAANGYQKQIRLLEKKSTAMQIGEDMDQRADLLVSEIVDVGLLGEGVIPTVRHARQNLLVEGAKMIPAGATVYAALIELPRSHSVYPLTEISGFDLSPFSRFSGIREYQAVKLEGEPHRFLSEPQPVWEVDFYNLPQECPDHSPRTWEFHIPVTASGHAHAVVFWFDLHLDDVTSVSTKPGSEVFCWGQAVQYQVNRPEVKAGETRLIHAEQSDNRLGFRIV